MNKTAQIVGQPSNGDNGATNGSSKNKRASSNEMCLNDSGVVPLQMELVKVEPHVEPLVRIYGGGRLGGKSSFNTVWRSLRTPPQTDGSESIRCAILIPVI